MSGRSGGHLRRDRGGDRTVRGDQSDLYGCLELQLVPYCEWIGCQGVDCVHQFVRKFAEYVTEFLDAKLVLPWFRDCHLRLVAAAGWRLGDSQIRLAFAC